MKEHVEVLNRIINTLVMDFGGNEFIKEAMYLLSRTKHVDYEKLSNILYGIISLYLIDEICTQPTEKTNFIDMGSYYYRSESYNIDFPEEYHEKYNIADSHQSREKSMFLTNKNFINNYLSRVADEELETIGVIVDKEVDFKVPSSRQQILIEYFWLKPNLFYQYFIHKYTKKFNESGTFKHRLSLNYDRFLAKRLYKKETKINITKNLSPFVGKGNSYVLTSSGTAANLLVMKHFGKKKYKNFFHRYWYYENLESQEISYFSEIKNNEYIFDNFFICIEPSNYVDIDNPGFTENIASNLSNLINRLKVVDKIFTIVLDVTSDPFFRVTNVPSNVNIIKTISLSKFQEGLNTNFAGIVIGKEEYIRKLTILSKQLGLNLSEIDERFLYLTDMKVFRKRVLKITKFCKSSLPKYKNWSIVPAGLSVALIPDKTTFNKHLKIFSNQTRYKDREFAWLLRDKVRLLLDQVNIDNISFGDSFLFPASRINIQGPKINASDYGRLSHTFKYRLPRISPGYECAIEDVEKYHNLYKKVIDMYMDEYKKI